MKKLFFLALSMLVAASCGGGRGELLCNYGSTDISVAENEHLMLAGFAARTQLSTGVHLPLRSHCLVISDGSEKVCIISNDLMEMAPALADSVREAVSARSGLAKDRILLHCIHTHSAPRLRASMSTTYPNYKYQLRALEAIVNNAVKVICDESAFRPFTMEIAQGETAINVNRCEAGGPRDGALYAVRFVDSGGRPICALINLACHPVCMGAESLLASSDYSGVARLAVAEEWCCEVFQLTGASGNMDPRGGCRLYDHAEAMGRELSDTLKSLKFKDYDGDGGLAVASLQVGLPYAAQEITPQLIRSHADSLSRVTTEFPDFAQDVRAWEGRVLEKIEAGGLENKLSFNITAVNIGGLIFFFTQGEPFCEYQVALREAFPERKIIFAGYANGQNAYLPSQHAFAVHKGYEYELDLMHVYIGSAFPLSDCAPAAYSSAARAAVQSVLLH